MWPWRTRVNDHLCRRVLCINLPSILLSETSTAEAFTVHVTALDTHVIGSVIRMWLDSIESLQKINYEHLKCRRWTHISVLLCCCMIDTLF